MYLQCSLIGLKTHYAASIDGIDFHPLHEMSCSLDLMNPVLASFCVSSCLSHRLFLKCVTPFFLCAAGNLVGVGLFLLTGWYYCVRLTFC